MNHLRSSYWIGVDPDRILPDTGLLGSCDTPAKPRRNELDDELDSLRFHRN